MSVEFNIGRELVVALKRGESPIIVTWRINRWDSKKYLIHCHSICQCSSPYPLLIGHDFFFSSSHGRLKKSLSSISSLIPPIRNDILYNLQNKDEGTSYTPELDLFALWCYQVNWLIPDLSVLKWKCVPENALSK